MKKFTRRDRIKIVFGATILFVGIILISMFIDVRKTAFEYSQLKVSRRILTRIQKITEQTLTAENLRQKYMVSGKESFLKEYNDSLNSADKELLALSALALSENRKKEDITKLIALSGTKRKHEKFVTETRHIMGYDSITGPAGEAEEIRLTSEFINQVNYIKKNELDLVDRRYKNIEEYATGLQQLWILLALFFITMISFIFYYVIKKGAFSRPDLHQFYSSEETDLFPVLKPSKEQLVNSEKALRFANERFELIAKATDDAVWDWNMITDTLNGNDNFCRLYSVEAGCTMQFKDFLRKVHRDDRKRIKQNFDAVLLRKGTQITEEYLFADGEGNYKVIYDRAYILYDTDNIAYRMLGAMQDITTEKETEHKLMMEKELSDSIINSLPAIFYIFNKKGKYYRWNKNFETVTGYSPEEITNMHASDFYPEENRDMLQKRMENVFLKGNDTVEADFLTKQGERIPFYFTESAVNYENEQCLMGVGIDISEKVKSEQELVKSEEKFRILMEQASDGIIITDEDGNLSDANDTVAAMTGYTKSELKNMSIYKVFFDENNVNTPFRYNEMMKGSVVLTERVIKRKNGRLLNVEVSGKQLPDGRFQKIIRDTTKRKLVEEALKLSEKKYHVLFDENPLPMWIISLPETTFLDVNNAALHSYGYSKEEFLHIHQSDLCPTMKIPEDPGSENAECRDKVEGFWDHQKKDGTIIKVNVISHNIIYEGREALLTLAEDVTSKYQAEENLQRSHEALRELAAHVETVREAERTHMAREIHDELGQQLTGLKMDISWLSKKIITTDESIKVKLKDTINLIDKTVVTVRRIATELRPSILDDLGLIAAMEWQSDEFEKRGGIKSVFKSNVTNITVSPEIATNLFRVFQESLTNVSRHSHATEVFTSFTVEKDLLRLFIADNGKGFNEEEILHKKTLGLLGMKERVLLINGTYEINGNAGTGTSVIITVPLKQLFITPKT